MAEIKSRILYILKYLWQNTDAEHYATTGDILTYLKENGISCDRKTIPGDIAKLCDNSSFGEIRKNYIRNEKKHQMRAIRSIHIFDVDEEFEEHHPEVATQSYNLVFCNSSGRPMEGQVITHALKKLIRENDLPDVVFHSFRHASITYKLKWNGGDVKSVQGDSGHARAEMVSNVYSHIIDEDRRFNAQRFEERFYQGNTPEADTIPPMPKFESSTELPEAVPIESDKKDETATDTQADTELITKLLSNPETAALLKALASKL